MPDEEEFVTTWGDTTTIYSTIIGEDNLAATMDPITIKSTTNRPTDEPSDEGSGEKSADNQGAVKSPSPYFRRWGVC